LGASFSYARKVVIPMPYKAKKPCAYPGCRELASAYFCPAHAKQDAREYNRYRRDPAHRKRYGQAWRIIRNRYIAAHPLCEKCTGAGRVTPAREVHHILPLAKGGTHDEDNLMALCSSCHSGITLGEINRKRR
jgi:5-methylcytosine-specific restriction protein A